MGRKIILCIIMSGLLLISPLHAYCAENDGPATAGELSKKDADKKLKEAFPELSGFIESAGKRKSADVSSDAKVIYRQSEDLDSGETAEIAILSDGSYMAYLFKDKHEWIGGSSATGSGYVSVKNKTLTVWQSLGLYTMTIYPVSYTLVNGAYDYFSGTGIASTPINSYIAAYPVQMKENASSPAFTMYMGKNVNAIYQSQEIDFTVEVRVGGDEVYVYLGGKRI